MPRINLFGFKIRELRQRINDFVFHKREELVFDVLWTEFQSKNASLTKDQRLEKLTSLLWKVADKEIIP